MEESLNKKSLAVLCDFDGTAVPHVIPYLLYKKFGDQVCEEYKQKWEEGEITTPQELDGCFSRLHPYRNEMEEYLETIPLSPGFAELVSWCREQGHVFAVLSDGLDWYIEYILERYGFSDVPIYANEIYFKQGGVEVESPWYSPKWPMRGTAKPNIIMRYQERGYQVVFIGDGRSDFEVVGYADQLFAKDHLLAYCREKGHEAVPISKLSDVVEYLSDLSHR